MSLVGPGGRAVSRWVGRGRVGRGRVGGGKRGRTRYGRARFTGRLAARGATVARFAAMFRVMLPKVTSNVAKLHTRGLTRMGQTPQYALSKAGNAGQVALVEEVSDVISEVAYQIFYDWVTPGYQTLELMKLEHDLNEAIDEGGN